MKVDIQRLIRIGSKIPIALVIVVMFAAGYTFRGGVTPSVGVEPTEDHGDHVNADGTIWTCSMHPEIRLPRPGKCPKCNMNLIPAAAVVKDEPKAKPMKYACTMLCLPPMDHPGKCPKCGMDMMPVEGDGGGFGSFGRPTLTLSPRGQKLAEVRVAPVERKFVSADIRLVGKVDYDETRLGHITAWVPGRLERLYVDYTGVPVKKGDHMVLLYSSDLSTAQTELISAKRNLDVLEAGASASIRQSAVRHLDAVRDRLRLWGLTEAQIKETEARGAASDHMTIYAPMGGIVIDKNAVEGKYVETGTRIYTIADLSHVWVMLDAYESDLAWVRFGQEVEFETEAYPGERFSGRIAFIEPVLNEKTRTVKVRVNVPNDDGRLKPGMFIRAVVRAQVAAGGRVMDPHLAGKWICSMHPEVVETSSGDCPLCGMSLVTAESLGFATAEEIADQPPLVIPVSAPLITGTRAVVYVALKDQPGTYEGREIVLGGRAGDYYLVRSGLSEGELVVVNGNFKIDSAIQLLAKPSMMSPTGGGAAPRHDHGAASAENPDGAEPSVIAATDAILVPETFRSQLAAVFDAYFAAQDGLTEDDLYGAKQQTRALGNAIREADAGALPGEARDAWKQAQSVLVEQTYALSAAGDLEAARRVFARLSESLVGVALRFGTGGSSPVYQFNCPKAFAGRGADWLQATPEVRNPYFGSAMYRCGAVKKTILPPSAPASADDKP